MSIIIWWILAVIALVVGIIVTIYQWQECREFGFGVFYCIKHIS